MRLRLWRGGKACGLRVDQDLTYRLLSYGYRPPRAVTAVRAADLARKRQADFPRPNLLVAPHRGQQVLHLTVIGPRGGEVQSLEHAGDAAHRPPRGDAERLREPALVHHADRHRFAVQ